MKDSGLSKEQWAAANYKQRLAAMLAAGWTMKSEGPSGAQLEGVKKMRTLDKVCLWFGILTSWLYGFGLIFIALALIDFWLLTKPPTYFLPAD